MGTRTRPSATRDIRALLDRPALAGLGLVVGVALLVVGVRLVHARPAEVPVPRPSAVVEPSAAVEVSAGSDPASSPASESATVLVHVAGAVRRPGLVTLAPRARVADAVQAAGGLRRRADAASVNLARPVADGEQIVVLRRAAAGGRAAAPMAPVPTAAPNPGAAPGQGSGAGPVNLNTATLEQLDALPGIGPVLAQRILDWRTSNQRFSSVEELGEVSGIGEATLADLRPLVTV